MATRDSLKIVDPVLSNFSLQYANSKLVSRSGNSFGMTADFIFPVTPHREAGFTGKYYTYNQGNQFQVPEALRGQYTEYNEIDWDVSSASYLIHDYGLKGKWDDNEISQALRPVDLNRDTTEVVTNLVLLAWERRVNTIATNASNFTNSGTPGTAWDQAGSDPISDVISATRTIFNATGVRPNAAVCGHKVWTNGLVRNDEVVGSVQASNKMAGVGDVTPNLVGQLMGVDLRVNDTLYNSANEGQTVSLSEDFGTYFLLFYKGPARVKALTLGLTMEKQAFKTRKWRKDSAKTNYVDVSHQTDEKLVANKVAYLYTSVVS